MRLNVWLVLLFVTLCVLLATAAPSDNTERKGNKKGGGVRRNKGEGKGSKNEVERSAKKGKGKKPGKKNKCNATPEPPEKACQSEAVRKCGRNFINNLQKNEGPDGKVPYKEKCLLRETFLNCVTENRVKPCRSRGHATKPAHREEMKRVAKYLWSTRGCLLGVDSP